MTEKDRKKAGQNAERDLHRRFAQLGLSLPLTPQPIEHYCEGNNILETHWVKPSTWIKVLLQKAPYVLMGKENHELQCSAFWELYRQHEPHAEIFSQRSKEELAFTIPILIFGDEGRGAKRGNFLVWTVESAIGLSDMDAPPCGCSTELAKVPANEVTRSTCGRCVVPPHYLEQAALQTTNYKGHSYTTRHLLFGIPHWLYKENKQIVTKHLDLLRDDLTSLFIDGVEFQGLCWFHFLIE